MKLTFIYQPVHDLAAAVAFHRDVLGLEEAWREDNDTVSFWLPDRAAQFMVSTDTNQQKAGPMFLVDNLDTWIRDHPAIDMIVAKYDIPGGAVAGFTSPGDNVFYVFDQPDT
jgi:catechol 2,3-dioxygenase-like lactoylglutathione lyase family enzyme